MNTLTRSAATVLVLGLLALLAVGSSEPDDVKAEQVKWSKYAPEVRTRVERLISDKDCRALQREFDIAHDNSDATRNRTGEGNEDLMDYLDSAMRSAGCYK